MHVADSYSTNQRLIDQGKDGIEVHNVICCCISKLSEIGKSVSMDTACVRKEFTSCECGEHVQLPNVLIQYPRNKEDFWQPLSQKLKSM